MVTQMKTRNRIDNRPGKKSNQEPLIFHSYPNPAVESYDNCTETESHVEPNGIADMDNLVYIYLSEMGQTPKLSADDEKALGSRIEQGEYLSKLESEAMVEDFFTPSAYNVFLKLTGHVAGE